MAHDPSIEYIGTLQETELRFLQDDLTG
jgi:hypothetical protein